MVRIVYDRCMNLQSFDVTFGDGFDGRNVRDYVKRNISCYFGDIDLDFYLLHNGRIVTNEIICAGIVHVIPCLNGGKGGFGSMLRAIGAQIEKTTNREACRDLSGRRLRDINEEKRLKKWIAEQAEREKEAAERKKRKLEKLCAEVRHDFSDANYDKVRSDMVENVHDAVEQGLKATSSTASAAPSTSAAVDKPAQPKKIKGSLWVDDLEGLDSSGSESESEEPVAKKIKAS